MRYVMKALVLAGMVMLLAGPAKAQLLEQFQKAVQEQETKAQTQTQQPAPTVAQAATATPATSAPSASPDAKIFNPQPADGDLVMPMPGNAEMVFRPVFLGVGDGPFALKRFTMGDPDGGFKESPTGVVIGGGFREMDKGKSDWLYYIGKYEVTEAQWYAVMGLPEGASANLLQSAKPMTKVSYFEVMNFIDKYNQWLYGNSLDKMPRNGGAVGFMRLPTEPEWEFAARGGSAVSADKFDRKKPFDGSMTEYEWFSGPDSSHNKLKKSGMLKSNPLALHDMLGNVSEMTSSTYHVEYYQGRSGGFVTRGGHYFTPGKKIRSSMRTEEPYYIGSDKKGYRPNAKETMGFRLVLSSVIYTDRNAIAEMEEAWDDYRASAGATLPAAASVAPTATKTGVKGEDALEHLSRLRDNLSASGAMSEDVQQELGYIQASLEKIKIIQKEADEVQAYAWAKTASEQGFFIYKESMKLPTVEKLLASAEGAGSENKIASLKKRKVEIEANIEGALTTYSDSFRLLSLSGPDSIDRGFAKYRDFLKQRDAREQLKVLTLVIKQFKEFNKEKRADTETWSRELSDLASKG